MSAAADLIALPSSRIVDVFRLALERPGTDLLCVGQSDQDSPRPARDALVAALEAGETRYADVRGLAALRHALADHLTALHAKPVAESRVVVTASGMAAINVAFSALLRPCDRVLIHTPLWPNMANGARLRGGAIEEIPLESRDDGGFRLDLDRLDAMLPGVRVFVLNSPSNPTGWTATAEEVAAILALCRRHGAWLLSDEVYSRITYDGAPAAPSVLDAAEPDDRVIVVNSFSKTWAMTGWRVGWLVGPAGTQDRFADTVEATHSGVASFAQHGAVAAVADEDFVNRFRDFCAQGRRIVAQALAGLNGVRFTPPDGAFYAFIGVEGLADSDAFAKRLVLQHGVAVAPGIAFGAAGEGHLRLCFAQSPALMERAMGRLRAGLAAR
jgi:aspartate/methionine/tyrosine aminotransferase